LGLGPLADGAGAVPTKKNYPAWGGQSAPLSRCPLLMEFALATLKIALNGRNLTFCCRQSLDSAASPTLCNVLAGWSSRAVRFGQKQRRIKHHISLAETRIRRAAIAFSHRQATSFTPSVERSFNNAKRIESETTLSNESLLQTAEPNYTRLSQEHNHKPKSRELG
jgi:hypothetical protein